jgi:hypothetical protein
VGLPLADAWDGGVWRPGLLESLAGVYPWLPHSRALSTSLVLVYVVDVLWEVCLWSWMQLSISLTAWQFLEIKISQSIVMIILSLWASGYFPNWNQPWKEIRSYQTNQIQCNWPFAGKFEKDTQKMFQQVLRGLEQCKHSKLNTWKNINHVINDY